MQRISSFGKLCGYINVRGKGGNVLTNGVRSMSLELGNVVNASGLI
jgi:hypothetical protein